jgi:post-segregation antitoxin (ccd killing protein)
MSDGYKLKITTESPKAIKELGGDSLFSMLGDMIHSIKNQMMDMPFMPSESPFFSLKKADFDIDDPIVNKFFGDGGFDLVNKAKGMDSNKAHAHFVMCYQNLNNFRLANLRNNIRTAYNNLQNASNYKNDAVKMERIANNVENKSTGYWQIESLKAIDNLYQYADSIVSKSFLDNSRSSILSGNKKSVAEVSDKIKLKFSSITPSEMKRVAYTTLSTQDNEPYLLCPKGKLCGRQFPRPLLLAHARQCICAPPRLTSI